ncbi:MAG: bifunctional UDP-N-acetylglucosamine pyrophosphorylase / glucosamine-phosphate N-acetyltransferase, partial [Actinomycetota bacterium]|nr:bifunctional UDP-N-acetylglucosamine pyrophosphorylase / glucosamine-phosphate N-acetyltransferase [Actinomycetota bacterium]
MTDSSLAVIVLAAGQGTRMRSSRPKILHELAGIPLVAHVLATARELDAAHVLTVVRHERDVVSELVLEMFPSTVIIEQDELPGTGRAVQLAVSQLPEGFSGRVVVLSADVPLLDAATVLGLLASHDASGNALTMISAFFNDPTGGGRVVRGTDGSFEAIVEHRDATEEQLLLTEVNAGVYVFDVAALRSVLESIGSSNSQNEMYLTDAAAGIRAAGGQIEAVPVSDHWLVAGINDRAQLSAVA